MDILGVIKVPTWLVLTSASAALAYIYSVWNHDYFKKRGIPGPKPYPFVGNLLQMLFKFNDMKEYDRHLVDTYGKFVGIFDRQTPILLIADVDVIKQVMVKEFHNFTNRKQMVKVDEKFTRNMLIMLEDDHWKHVRNLMTPSFTTGKLKQMHGHINQCAGILVENLTEKAGENIDVKEHASAFTFDAIARTAFGLELNAQKDPDNPFIKHAKIIMSPNMFGLAIAVFSPFLFNLIRKLPFNLFGKNSREFFFDMGEKLMEERTKNPKEQPDFLQLLMNAHIELPSKEDLEDEELMTSIRHDDSGAWTKKGLTKDEVIGNLVLFFLVGMDTTARSLTLVLYHLAINPEAMERVIREVDEVVGTKDTITPDMTSRLTYTEQCIMETLRINTLAIRTTREAKNSTTLGGIHIPKGLRVDVALHALHHDPNVYPEPSKFDPDRFTQESRASRDPLYWMPFGIGPRNCIGLRLAMVELKISLAKIFQKLCFKACEETNIPLVYKMGMLPKSIKLRVETRDK